MKPPPLRLRAICLTADTYRDIGASPAARFLPHLSLGRCIAHGHFAVGRYNRCFGDHLARFVASVVAVTDGAILHQGRAVQLVVILVYLRLAKNDVAQRGPPHGLTDSHFVGLRVSRCRHRDVCGRFRHVIVDGPDRGDGTGNENRAHQSRQQWRIGGRLLAARVIARWRWRLRYR